MTLNASGPISLGGSTVGESVNLELGQSATATISFNDAAVRTLTGTTAGSTLSMPGGFWGKSTAPYRFTFFNTSATTISPNNMFVDSSGNTYLASDYGYVVKFDTHGTFVWGYNIYKTGPVDYRLSFFGINVDASGNVYLTGSYGSGTNNYDVILKLDSSGVILWKIAYLIGTGVTEKYSQVLLDSTGNVYWLSNVLQSGTNYPTITKLDSSGTTIFQKTITLAMSSLSYAKIDASNNLYLSGTAGAVAAVMKLDSNANILWQRNLTHATDSVDGWDIAFDSSSNVYMFASSTYVNGSALLVKYNSSGTLQWKKVITPTTATFTSNNVTPAISISVDSSNNVYFGVPGPYTGGPKTQFFGSVTSSGTLRWLNEVKTTAPVASASGCWGLTQIGPDGNLWVCSNIPKPSTGQYFDFMAILPTTGTDQGSYSLAGISFSYLAVTASISDATALSDTAGSATIATSSYYPYVITFYTTAYTTTASTLLLGGP
jgi:hypothetical protein